MENAFSCADTKLESFTLWLHHHVLQTVARNTKAIQFADVQGLRPQLYCSKFQNSLNYQGYSLLVTPTLQNFIYILHQVERNIIMFLNLTKRFIK